MDIGNQNHAASYNARRVLTSNFRHSTIFPPESGLNEAVAVGAVICRAVRKGRMSYSSCHTCRMLDRFRRKDFMSYVVYVVCRTSNMSYVVRRTCRMSYRSYVVRRTGRMSYVLHVVCRTS